MGRIYISGNTHGLSNLGKLQRLSATESLTKDDIIIIAEDCGVVWHKDLLMEFVKDFV